MFFWVILIVENCWLCIFRVGKDLSGGMDVVNLFKLMLVWGKFKVIGVIILNEYWEYIEKDFVFECWFV